MAERESVEDLAKKLSELSKHFKDMRKLVPQEFLEIYIKEKCKVPRSEARKMLEAEDEFFNKLIAKLTAERF